jgi:Carboxypeptidase regulatory-like domain/TonB dependent receptor
MKSVPMLWNILVLAVLAPAALVAQVSSGQISGRVTDSTGAVLPGVTVTMTQTETQFVRSVVTNELGVYSLTNLPVGPYRLTAALQGFATFVRPGIDIFVNANLVIDPVLGIGDVAETITVEGRASDIEIETRRMGVGTVVEQERILELPLNARQVTDLIPLSGAAVQVPASATATMVTGVNISVAGGARFGVQYLVDGAMSNNRFDASNMPLPFPDALEEFRLSTGAQEAAIGRSSGASVNAVTKSGTNQFHGNAFWFVRDQKFNARPAHSTVKDPLQRNQPGGAIGGPIIPNRLFFFTGYQSTILNQTQSDTLSIVPTAAMMNGDWRAFNACHRPNWSDADFRDDLVDPARYSSAARRLVARLPQPQNDCGELRWGSRVERHDKQTLTRIDFQPNGTQTFFGRYMATLHDQPVTADPNNLLSVTATTSGFNDRAHSAVVGHNWVMSSSTVTSSRFGYNGIRARKQGARFFNPEDVGIAQWTSVPNYFTMTVPGNFTFGFGPLAQREVDQNQYQIGQDVTFVRGAHQFSAGGTWAYDDVVSLAHTLGVGNIAFTAANTGHAMGDFLLGRVDNIRQSMPSTLSPSQQYAALYAQDTWRVNSRVTLNYGVRWEPFFPMVWRENPYGGIRVYNFGVDEFQAGQESEVFSNAPAGFSYPSQSPDGSGPADFEGHAGVPTRLNKWAPRLGVGWDPTGSGRTAVRASYGLSNDVVALEALLNSNNVSPWAADIIHRTGTLDNPWAGLAGGNPFPFDWRVTPLFLPGSVFMPFSENLNTPYVQQWNLTVEQQLAGRWLASASYVGTQTDQLWNTTAVNPALVLTPQSHPSLFTGPDTCVLEGRAFTPCNQTTNILQRRELRLWAAQNQPALLADAALFANIDELRSDSTADYHSLLLSTRGAYRGVNVDANYTLSKCMSDRIAPGIPNPNETFHRGRDRSYCQSDRLHQVNLMAVATAPDFDDGVWNAIASDWRLAVLYKALSGEPLTILAGSDRATTGLVGQTADQVLDNVFLDRSGELGSQYLNRLAFAPAAIGSYGNMDFFAVRGLATWTLDMALSRIFDIGANRIEVRAEVFNLPNAVVPQNPSTTITDPNFGTLRTARDPRIMQFALKYVF